MRRSRVFCETCEEYGKDEASGYAVSISETPRKLRAHLYVAKDEGMRCGFQDRGEDSSNTLVEIHSQMNELFSFG